MKTINKILPLAILASATAVVTPLATSCSGVGSTWIDGLQEIDDSDLFAFDSGDFDDTKEAEIEIGQLVYNAEHSTDPDAEEYRGLFKKDFMYGRYILSDLLLELYNEVEYDHYRYTIDTFKQDEFFEYNGEYINLYSYKGDLDLQFMYLLPGGLGSEESYIEIAAKAHIDLHCVPLTVYSEDNYDFNPFYLNAIGFFPVILQKDSMQLPSWMYFANDWYYSWSLELTRRQFDSDKKPLGNTIVESASIHLDANHLEYAQNPEDYSDIVNILPQLFFEYGLYTIEWPSFSLTNIDFI